ncbi:MAG: SDR family oxidoreductase [Flavobacteriales bacterium]
MSKTIVVTGGTSGIGLAICSHLANKDYTVFGAGRKINSSELPDSINWVEMDVTRVDSIKIALKQILEKTGRIDVLINNAGIGMAGAIEECNMNDVMTMFQTNVYGTIRTSKEVLPYMRKQAEGLIINISSIGGLMGLPYRGIYSSTKSSIETISEALSMETMQFGVKVVIIEPGDFNTAINQNRKIVQPSQSSPYLKDFNRIHGIIQSEVSQGEDPILIGKLVERIILTKKPKLRYRIGNKTSRLALFLKAILPDRLFEKLMMQHYKINRK